jgi:serine/threonine protein kinase/formylglycine-generating enzyme required for sulfatase activity
MAPWDEKAVFLRALALPKDQRDAFLKEECPDKAAEDRIKTLLLHHEAASDEFLSNTTKTSPASAPATPTQIDEFTIIHRLGEGGMGVVYLAEDTILGRRVALKVLARHLTGSEQALARFREEARSAAALNHPAIVPVYKFGRAGEDTYLVAEFVDGRTLADLIIEKRRTLVGAGAQDIRKWHRQAAEIVATIADALDCAHRARIVHRDVKPSNILIDRERGPRLTDFGIAKHLTEENRTEYTRVIGSCHYMSPEQANIADSRVDQRSDIFSLGVVLYEMLGLRLPFEGATVQQVLRAVSECAPPRLRAVDRRVPVDLETICHKAIEKRPEDRYQTAAHIAADLRCFLAGDPILAKPPSAGRRIQHWIKNHRTGVAVSLFLLILLTAGLLAWRLQQAAEASMAWLSIHSELSNCSVFVQKVNPETYQVSRRAQLIGMTPIAKKLLPVGQYRVTVVSSAAQSFTEFNALLMGVGASFRTDIWTYPPGNERVPPLLKTGAARELYGLLAAPEGECVSNMVLIAAGNYSCGLKGDEIHSYMRELPSVPLPAFYIDTQEVSNADYKRFVDATGHRRPPHWKRFGYDPALAKRPIVEVSFDDAEAYARWIGKRLPTHLEWQAAARGPRGSLYPWGSSPRDASALPKWDASSVAAALQNRNPQTFHNLFAALTVDCGKKDAFICASGLLQIFDNVHEITASVELETIDGLAMGRSWFDNPADSNLAQVWTFPLNQIPSACMFGFRCAKSAVPPIHSDEEKGAQNAGL